MSVHAGLSAPVYRFQERNLREIVGDADPGHSRLIPEPWWRLRHNCGASRARAFTWTRGKFTRRLEVFHRAGLDSAERWWGSHLACDPLLPDVPSLAEADLQNYSCDAWYCDDGPAGVPNPVVARLHTETKAIVAIPKPKPLWRQGSFRSHLPAASEAGRDAVARDQGADR